MAVDSYQDIEHQKHSVALERMLKPEQHIFKGIVSNCRDTVLCTKRKMSRNKVKITT
jgi:hypothetical protein